MAGYPEILTLGSVLLLIAAYLTLRSASGHTPRGRLLLFGAWGLAAGPGLWSAPLLLPFVLSSGLLLALGCRSELRLVHFASLAVGLPIGFMRAIIYNLSPGAGQSTITSILSIARAGGSGHVSAISTEFPNRIAGTVAVSLPVITGGNGICALLPQDAWPLSGSSTSRTVRCTVVHSVWGAGVIVLWLVSVGLAMSVLWRFRDPSEPLESGSRGRSRQNAAARLAVLGAGGLTVAVFLATPAPAVAPWFNVRYLTGVWIALPEIIAPLAWLGAGSGLGLRFRAAGLAILLIVGASLVSDTASAAGNGDYDRWLSGQEQGLAATLLNRGVHAIYSDYWTCDWIAFETRERVICAALAGRHPRCWRLSESAIFVIYAPINAMSCRATPVTRSR